MNKKKVLVGILFLLFLIEITPTIIVNSQTSPSSAYVASITVSSNPFILDTATLPAINQLGSNVRFFQYSNLTGQLYAYEQQLPQTTPTVNSVESTCWSVLPYWENGQLVINTYSVSVTVTNSQPIATPAPFDQFLNITESQIASALGSTTASQLWQQAMLDHFLNLLFQQNGQTLYAWIQNYTSSWIAVWVKLPNGIPASSSVTITIHFTEFIQYPYTGIAPYLTSTYGQYDNGEDVFIIYQNFAGTTLPSGWTAVSGTYGSDYVVNNGLQLKTTNAFIEGSNVTQNFILEGYFQFISNAYNGWDFGVYSSSSSAYGMHPDGGGNTNSWASTWYYNDGYTEISSSGDSVGTGYYYIWQIINNAGSITTNFDNPSYTTLYSASFTNSLNSAPIALGERFNGTDAGQSLNVIFYWIRVRAYPPNGVMPSNSQPQKTIILVS